MSEFEIKLHVPAERFAAVGAAVARGATGSQRLRASYYDTADDALAAHRIVLRVRREGASWVQTVKAAGDNVLHRIEDNVPFEAAEGPRPVLRRHRGTAAGRLLEDVLGDLDDQADAKLVERYRTDVERTTRMLAAGQTSVELALDTGRIVAGRRSAPVQELELELKQGERAAAVEVAQQWCEQHGLWLDTVSKSERGLRLAAGLKQPEAVGFEPPALRRKDDSLRLARALVGAALHQVLGNASEIALGRYGDEHVHQMRVGLRRLRTALRELDRFEPFASARQVETLAQAFRALGAQRDATHVQPLLVEQMRADGGPDLHFTPADANPPDPVATVRDGALQMVLLQLLGALSDGDRAAALGARDTLQTIETRLQKLYRRALKDGKRFEDLPHVEQHGLRKRFKRLRYLCEFTGALYGKGEVRAFIDELKPVQDALGEYQDLWAAAEFWQQRAAHDPNAWFAVGWLHARRQSGVDACAQACARFAKRARPYWG